ncbi:MAG TPA: response regulator [Gemmatimonadaceae bacterium]
MPTQRMTSPVPPEKRTILLVDDEHAVRLIVLKILRRANYNVIEASSGEEALKAADAHPGPIDLVVTDMFMPGMRGPEVVQTLRAKRPGLRVLFMSGYADHDPKLGVPFGANFLGKPFSGQELAAAVESALKGNPVS